LDRFRPIRSSSAPENLTRETHFVSMGKSSGKMGWTVL